MINKFLNKNKWVILGSLLGAIAGYIYYWQIGCATGTCAITSKPLNSMVYFGMMGGLAFSALTGRPNTNRDAKKPIHTQQPE